MKLEPKKRPGLLRFAQERWELSPYQVEALKRIEAGGPLIERPQSQ